MVKRIKKRVPKSNVDTQPDSDSPELEGVEGVEGTDSSPTNSERLRAEINANANNASADRFSELAEGFFLGIAEHWVILVLLGLVGVGVYGFIQYNDQQHQESLASSRSSLQSELQAYLQLQDQAQSAMLIRAAAAKSNPLGLSVSPEGEVEGPKPEAFSEVAGKFGAVKTSELSAPLATLAQASALFDAAQSSEDYVKVAELFTQATTQSDQIEMIAQGIAFKNAAISYEEAARLADDKSALWAKAIEAWKKFGAANEIFVLTAQVNQARVMRLSKDMAGARKLYQEIKRNHAQLSSNRTLNQQVKIGLALTAEAKPTEAKPTEAKQTETKPAETKPAEAKPAE